ncbi:phage tail tube protein, partial [Klebsiella pneumoniae]
TAGAWNLLRRSSFGLKPTQNTNDNDEITGDRMAQGVSRGTVDVGGDVGTRFRWNQHDDFLASCFGSEWLNNLLTMGNGRITFSVATFASDVGIAQIARGCQVGTFQMEIPGDGDITATITFAGLDWETKGDDTSYFTTPVDLAGALRYSFKEVTNIRLNGVDGGTGFCVDTFNIQFNNNMQTQRCIGTGSAFAGANIPTTFTPSG